MFRVDCFELCSPLEEVVVTARKRTETLLDAPVAVQAFTADLIDKAGINRPQDFLGLIANVTYVTSNHQGEFFVNMRGQASVRFAESAVAVVIDGVQLSTGNEFNSDFFDIEQIVVLKGPQNSLYGRNATAGAIIINTRAPSEEWEGTVLANFGNWDSMKLQGGGGGPITDNLSMRFSASLTDSDGPFTNIVTSGRYSAGPTRRAVCALIGGVRTPQQISFLVVVMVKVALLHLTPKFPVQPWGGIYPWTGHKCGS